MVEVNDVLSLLLSIYKYKYHDAFFVKSNSIHDVIIGDCKLEFMHLMKRLSMSFLV